MPRFAACPLRLGEPAADCGVTSPGAKGILLLIAPLQRTTARAISMSSILDRQNTVAPSGFNRFLVPPAAMAVHLAIGQVYAFSTFNLPLTKLIGLKASAPGDWNLKQVGWVFSIAIAILGISAAVFGRWVEAAGSR